MATDQTRMLSLCTGTGTFDHEVQRSLSDRGHQVQLVAFAENDTLAAKVFQNTIIGKFVPNLGDITVIENWIGQVGHIDVLTAGYPCQPFSQAGSRRGTDDPRHIWPHIAGAIDQLRPRYVFLENVSGHRAKGFDIVLGDLASLGYDATWCSLRVSDVGGIHQRDRVFILAIPAAHTPSATG